MLLCAAQTPHNPVSTRLAKSSFAGEEGWHDNGRGTCTAPWFVILHMQDSSCSLSWDWPALIGRGNTFRWLPSKTSERSRVGQKLSDLTTQKVIVGILALLLIIPVFNIYSGLYGTYSSLVQGGLRMLHNLYLDVGFTKTLLCHVMLKICESAAWLYYLSNLLFVGPYTSLQVAVWKVLCSPAHCEQEFMVYIAQPWMTSKEWR